MTDSHRYDVVVVGAGLSGLMAATELGRAGRRVLLLDKGRGVGGRMATRRVSTKWGEASVDHGAQFFTARSPEFTALVDQWIGEGVVREWCRGFSAAGDGYPRYAATGGMNALAKHLAASLPSSVDVRCDATVQGVAERAGSGSITVRWADDQADASVVVLTAPVPQSLEMLDESIRAEMVFADAAELLGAVRYAKCLALLVVLDDESAVPEPGGMQHTVHTDPYFSFVGDNAAKGISAVPALTFHVHDEPSEEWWDRNPAEALVHFLDAAHPYLGQATVLDAQLKRWRYARPTFGVKQDHLRADLSSGTLVFCGDAFGSAKVEGAVLSGLAAGRTVLSG